MRIVSTRRLRGPNRYLDRPVLVARVRLDELTGRESTDVPGFTGRLLDLLPGLAEHHCAAGRPGGFVDRLRGGTYFGHITEHVAIELSNLIGRTVSFGRTEYADEGPGGYDVVMECPQDEPADCAVPQRLLALARRIVTELVAGGTPAFDAELADIRAESDATSPGPSTAAIAAAARARGIPVERVGPLSLLRLGWGRHRRLVWAAMTDQTSAVGLDIAGDKELTRRLLADAGIPVPAGGPAGRIEQALALFGELGAPVVVKPRSGRQGRHVFLGVDSPEALLAAFEAAVAETGEVVVEQQLAGRDYRVLTVDGELVAAAERIPAHVVGDGVRTVADLVERVNADPRRGAGHARELTRLCLDDVAAVVLCRQGLTAASVPAEGQVVWLRDNANLSTGGTSRDVTDDVHPDVVELCRRISAVVGLDVSGIDLRLADITAPLPATGVGAPAAGGVIEVNAAPGLRMHLAPTVGRPRDVATAIVASLYPPGSPSRIPTVAVTGTNGKTTTARLVSHLLAAAGHRTGLTSTDGVYVGGRLVQRADATGPRSCQTVLGDPTVTAAVLETARGGMLRQGLGYDHTDVGVVTNIDHDHLGQDGLVTVADLVDVKALVAERVRDGGTLVLNADDPRVRGLVERPRTRAAHKRLVWFGLQPDSPVVATHCRNGGRAYLLDDGWLVERTGDRSVAILTAAELPGGFGGAARFACANALAAAAAGRALGLPLPVVADGLRSFRPREGNPGRGILLRRGDVHLLVDYAHNPAAICAMADTLRRVWGPEHMVAAVTLPGDRRDDLLAEAARAIADGFDRVVVYEDADRRGRAAGEVPALVRREIAAYRPEVRCGVVRRVEEAVPAALAMAAPGDVVLVMYDRIDPVLALLGGLGAVPVEDPSPARRGDGSEPAPRFTPAAGSLRGV